MGLAGMIASPSGQITRQPARPSVMTSIAPLARRNDFSCASGAAYAATGPLGVIGPSTGTQPTGRHLHPAGYVHGGAWVAFADTVAAWGTLRHLPEAM